MTLTKRLSVWYKQRQERTYRDREDRLTIANQLSRERGEFTNKTIETYIAPPSFMLYLWAAFPLLFIATLEIKSGIAAIVGTIINFVLIHLDMDQILRYAACSIVLSVLVLLYYFNVI